MHDNGKKTTLNGNSSDQYGKQFGIFRNYIFREILFFKLFTKLCN